MMTDLTNMGLNTKDIEMIEAALHTQKKILSVQSEAGGIGAREKLSDLTRLMKRIKRARTSTQTGASFSPSQFVMNLFCPQNTCSHTR